MIQQPAFLATSLRCNCLRFASRVRSGPVRWVQSAPPTAVITNDSNRVHMLICKFASHRSRPDKIRDWINYLEALKGRHENDSNARSTLKNLLDEARTWTAESASYV
jgi:hypothetical protein